MDIPIGLIIIAILALLLALVWLFKMEIPRQETERYQKELEAETRLLANFKPVVSGGSVVVPCGYIDGQIKWEKFDTPQASAQAVAQAEQMIPLDDTAPITDPDLDVARQIVIASISKPLNDNQLLPGNRFTSQRVWQRGINAMTNRQWARAGGSGTYPAIGHDLGWLLRQIENAMNLTSGVAALPQAKTYDERIKLAGNGNGNA